MFASTPLAILQPRTAIAWQFEPNTVLRTGFGVFSDILPGSVADLVGVNPPYVQTFQGGLLGTVGGTAIAPGVPNSAVDATIAANQRFSSGFAQGQLSCASPLANLATCLPPVAITAVPDGKLHAPYFMQWSLGIEHQFGNTGSIQAQYVGTRAVNQPYLTQVNGYQTVCQGCFTPFPYMQPTDPRFAAVTQLLTGANSNYNGLQLTAMKRMGHGLQGQVNYTWSHCLDTVSNGGFLQFSSGGILSPLPGDLRRDYGPCDYDIRHNLNGQYVYVLPIKVENHALGYALNGWQVSGTVFWHSGVPFSVLSTPYSANGNGIVQGSGPQFASLVPGVDPYCRHCDIPGVTQPGTIQWLNPNAFVSAVDPATGTCNGGNSAQNCQFGNLGRNALRGPNFFWSDFYITKWFPLNERVKLRFDAQFFNVFNHPNFGLPSIGAGRHSGKTCHTNWFRRADVHYVSSNRAARSWIGRRQQSSHDRVSGAIGVLIRDRHLPGNQKETTWRYWVRFSGCACLEGAIAVSDWIMGGCEVSSKPYQEFESTSLRQQVSTAEKLSCTAAICPWTKTVLYRPL